MQKLSKAVFCTDICAGGVQKLSGTVFCTATCSGGVQKLSGAVFCTDETAEKLTVLYQTNGELVSYQIAFKVRGMPLFLTTKNTKSTKKQHLTFSCFESGLVSY